LVTNEFNNEDHLKLYSIPDIDVPPSPPPRQSISSSSSPTESNILDILTLASSLPKSPPVKKPPTKRKKKKKPLSEYRPPSPFSPKPDYKSMDIDQLKKNAMKYGLSTTQAKGRLIKILDEIYNVTHQYETDSDYEFDLSNDLSHTPPTPAMIPPLKKSKKRQAIHQMSSSDDNIEQPPAKKPALVENKNDDQSNDDDDADHEGRFLELTVYDLSSSTTSSSSSSSIIDTPPTLSLNDIQLSDSKSKSFYKSSKYYIFLSLESSTESSSQKPKSKPSKPKKPKLETPTIPLKEIVRNYIESNPSLHARILSYDPIDFEEFYKQLKTDLNLKIASKELMQCLDDQCITFTLRSRKGAFTSVMRAKRRNK
jgi:hypothetical protein